MNNEYIEALKTRRDELNEELKLLNGILDKYNLPSDSKTSSNSIGQSEMFTPVFSEDKSKTMSITIKNGIRKLVEHPFSLQIDDIETSFEKYGIEASKSGIHNALRSLRENGDVIAYKVNNSNQMVFYISPDGVDKSLQRFPVKLDYRPVHIKESDIESFDFLN